MGYKDAMRRLVPEIMETAKSFRRKLLRNGQIEIVRDEVGRMEIERMHYEDGHMEVIARHPMVATMANEFVKSFDLEGAVNCLEFRFTHTERGAFSLTIQREGGKTPMELRDEALDALEECASLLEKIQAQTEEPLAMPWPQIQRAREILERGKR